MKLSHVEIQALLGIKHADIRLTRPALLVVGQNGAGKSSLSECLRLALLAESPRVELKKHYGSLVHEGAKAGMVALNTSEGAISVHITADGKVTDSAKGREAQAFIEYVLDPSFFAKQDRASRRALLFKLLGLDLSPDAIKKRLVDDKGCDAGKVDAVAPILRAGFEAAAKHAASEATQAKGAFRAVTQETWGSSKGSTWRAPSPPFSGDEAAELQKLDKAIADLEAQQADATKRCGVVEHEHAQAKKRADTIEHLRAKAKTHAEHSSLVNTVSSELGRLKASLLDAQQKAGTAPAPQRPVVRCPACSAELVAYGEGKSMLLELRPQSAPVAHDPAAAARIPELQKAVASQERTLARHQQNQREADEAGIQLKALEDDGTKTKHDDPAIIRQTVETLRQQIEANRTRQAELQAAQRALDVADEKTKAARQHHADVLAWDAIAKALGPDGIPADILSEALGPVNERLALSAADTGWPQVVIDKDMGISYGGRAFELCSESEQWRANAVLAEAISHLSGLKLLVLDRGDLLDAEGWAQLMKWADTLCFEKDIETLIVLATKDGPPEGITDLMQAVQLVAGNLVDEREAVAA